MADYIKASSGNLEQLANRLNRLQGRLSSVSATLNSIQFNAENGGHLTFGRVAGGLSGMAGTSSVQGTTISSAAKQTARVLSHYGQCGTRLSRAVRQVEDLLQENDKTLRDSFYGATGAVDIGALIGSLVKIGAQAVLPIGPILPIINWNNILKVTPWVLPTITPRIGIPTVDNPFHTGATVFSAMAALFGGELKYEGDNSQAKVEGKSDFKYSFKDAFKDFNDAHQKDLYKPGATYEGDGDRKHSVERGNFGIGVGVGFSESINAWQAKGEFKNGAFSGEGRVAVSELEAHGSATAGMYNYVVDENGETRQVFAPGAGVELGASYTVLKVEGKTDADLGFGSIGIGGDVSVGKVGAGVEGQIGYVDGKFGLNVSASAEANLVEANADIHGGINGVANVKGEVGVTVGIGGHADIGYHDGVIKADIGASIGLGVKADVTIDLNPAIQTVSKIGEGVCEIGEAAWDLGKAAWNNLTSWW